MKHPTILILQVLFTGLLLTVCQSPNDNALVGAWRGKVQFSSGAFAAVKDLEFMYVFIAGGIMPESSNYDGAPPCRPRTECGKKPLMKAD